MSDEGTQSERTVGALLVETLRDCGARVGFGIPGVHSLAMYDALRDQEGLDCVTARSEQGAGYMAEGYARASGMPGLLLTIGGPGATNALTPVADAFADSVPLIHISSEIPRENIGTRRGYLHAMRDQLGVFRAAIGKAYRLVDPNLAAKQVVEAWAESLGPPPGPVYIEVPLDVLEEQVRPQECVRPRTTLLTNEVQGPFDEAADLLKSARHPLIYVGGGANNPEASRAVLQLAEALQAPVITTTKGKGVVPADHPLHIGCSWASEVRKSDWFREADVVLAVGTRLSRRTHDLFGHLPLPENLIHLDADPTLIGTNYATRVALVGSAADGLDALRGLLPARSERGDTAERVRAFRDETRRAALRRAPRMLALLDTIAAAVGPDTISTHDLNTVSVWAASYLPVYRPRHFLFPMEFGVLGLSLPGAIGAKLAQPEKPVVAFAGDGSFLFSCQELATAVQLSLQVVVLVFNDDAYGSVARFQRRRYGREYGTQLRNPDFVALARSFGAHGFRCDDLARLPELVKHGFDAEGPTLVEVPLGTDWTG